MMDAGLPEREKKARRLRKLLVFAAICGAVYWMLDAFARQALYPAPAVPVPSPPPAPLEEVRLSLATGERAVAWAYTPADLPPAAPVVLFFHGNGENLQTMSWAGLYEDLGQLGIAFLAADYPGYGLSTGRPSEEGLLATGDAAVAWALERHPGRPVIVCGWSLGAALSLATAARRPGEVQGVAVLSPWTSLADVARHHFPPFLVSVLLRERYDSLAAARQVGLTPRSAGPMPALVIHGEVDDLIPTAQGRRIADALAGPATPADTVRWVPVPGAGHNDLLAQPVVWEELARFFSRFG